MTNLTTDLGLTFGRLQRHVGIVVTAEILGRVTPGADRRFLVKGGSHLEFRLGPTASRSSKDLDGVFRGDFDTFFNDVQDRLRAGWSGFTGTAGRLEEIAVPGMAVRPRRFAVALQYNGKPFMTVPVEASPAEAGVADELDDLATAGVDALKSLGFATTTIACVTIRWQVAQKLHACTDPGDVDHTNERARDLVDLCLLEPLISSDDLATQRAACVEVFETRDRHGWPPTVSVPPSWSAIYAAAVSGLPGAPLDVDAAADRVRELIVRIDRSASP
jgi:hypothetical protein